MKALAFTALALLVSAGAAAAQTAAASLNNDVPTLGPSRTATALTGGAEVSAGSDDSSVTLRAAWVDSNAPNYTVRTLTLSAPLGKGGGPTDLASLDALANSTTLEFKWSNVAVAGRQRPKVADLAEACDEARTAYTTKHGKPPADDSSCAGLAADDPDQNSKWEDLFFAHNAYALIYGAGAKVGYNQFDYNDPTTLAQESRSRTPWSVSGFLTYYGRANKVLASGSYEHQEAYADADTKTVCPVVTPPVTCVSGPLGAPKLSQQDLFSLDLRKMFSASLGAAATFTYDAHSDVWGVETPIYFVRNPSGDGLTGGVKLGWRSDKHDLRASIFIGKAFSLLNF